MATDPCHVCNGSGRCHECGGVGSFTAPENTRVPCRKCHCTGECRICRGDGKRIMHGETYRHGAPSPESTAQKWMARRKSNKWD
jgi:hypothetical protein